MARTTTLTRPTLWPPTGLSIPSSWKSSGVGLGHPANDLVLYMCGPFATGQDLGRLKTGPTSACRRKFTQNRLFQRLEPDCNGYNRAAFPWETTSIGGERR